MKNEGWAGPHQGKAISRVEFCTQVRVNPQDLSTTYLDLRNVTLEGASIAMDGGFVRIHWPRVLGVGEDGDLLVPLSNVASIVFKK